MREGMLKTLGRNKLYLILAVFIVSINLLSFFSEKREAATDARNESAVTREEWSGEKKTLFDAEDMKAREARFMERAKKEPRLILFLAALNLLILFLIFAGLILDGYFIARFISKRPVDIRAIPSRAASWNVSDIARAALIFLSCGYVFAALQYAVADRLPIFDNDNFRMVLDTTLMNVVGISVIFYFVAVKYGQKIDTIGLTGERAASNVFIAIIGYISIIPVMLTIMIITAVIVKKIGYTPPVQPIVQVLMQEKMAGVLLMSTLFAAVFGPVAEEIFFRGFMYPAVRKKFGALPAIMLTSFIFAALHAHLVGLLPIMVLGIMLAYLYEKTGSLVPCVSLHVLHNIAMLVLVAIVRSAGAV